MSDAGGNIWGSGRTLSSIVRHRFRPHPFWSLSLSSSSSSSKFSFLLIFESSICVLNALLLLLSSCLFVCLDWFSVNIEGKVGKEGKEVCEKEFAVCFEEQKEVKFQVQKESIKR